MVIGEARKKDTDAAAYAEAVALQIERLINASVPTQSIKLVGASKGAFIAASVSHRLDHADLSYVLLASCHPSTVDYWRENEMALHGNVSGDLRRRGHRLGWQLRRSVRVVRQPLGATTKSCWKSARGTGLRTSRSRSGSVLR